MPIERTQQVAILGIKSGDSRWRNFMALPQRRDPDEWRNGPQALLHDLGDHRTVERVSRGGWRWWWIWPVVIALAFWWAGWGWGGNGAWWWGRVNSHNTRIPAHDAATTETLANAGANQPIDGQPLTNSLGRGPAQTMAGPGVAILTAPSKQAFIGEKFAANDIPVQQKVDDHVMWIGEKQPMLAVLSGASAASANEVVHGAVVDAIGIVKKAPPAAQAKREWGLNNQQASRLEHDGAYIQISHLTVPPPQ
jgi:hypothetical protein